MTHPSDEASFVIGAWTLSGAPAGVLFGGLWGLANEGSILVTTTAVGMGVGAIIGFVGYTIDRHLASGQVGLVDHHGRRRWPVHGALYVAPAVVAFVSLIGLVVVGSVMVGSLYPALMFGLVGFGVAAAGRKVIAQHRLQTALTWAESGQSNAAIERLTRLQGALWVTPHVRRLAGLNLGLIALRRGDLDAAAAWLRIPGDGSVQAFARCTLALVQVLRDQHDSAAQLLHRLRSGKGGRVVREQGEAVRLMLSVRRAEPLVAHELGERLLGGQSSGLLVGLVAWLRWQTGDEAGARCLLSNDARDQIIAGGLRSVIFELDQVLTWVESAPEE